MARQLELAQELNLPVIIHSREAYERTLDFLIEKQIKRAVFHCYSGDLEFAKRIWSYGFYTSFTGTVTYPNALEVKRVVKEVPAERFMLETDCPFMTPQAFRGQRNEPKFIPEIAREVAAIRGTELEEIAAVTTQNAKEFFGI